MKCLILAAGYATRLYPLTENFPKPLLKVGDKAILDWLIEDIDRAGAVDEYVVISNHKFAGIFEEWAASRRHARPDRASVTVLDDGTTSNETRLGAVRDIQFAIDRLGLDDDLLVIAGDNLLDFSLVRFIDYARTKGTTCIMRYYEPSVEKLRKTGVATVDDNGLILSMVEKPAEPQSHWCCPPFYFYRREDVPLVKVGIESGCGVDAPGSFIAWLSGQTKVHAWEMPGRRYDIGNLESYEEVQRNYKGIKDMIQYQIANHGAELQSLRLGNREYLWQGDPAYWGRRAPILFPIVGKVAGDTLRVNGHEYVMKQHGFARDAEFEPCGENSDGERYVMVGDGTRENYPYKYELAVTYRADRHRLYCQWEVTNRDERSMHFQIGAHPAFNLPDYNPADPVHGYLECYDAAGNVVVPMLTHYLIAGLRHPFSEPRPLPVDGTLLPITNGCFDADAYLLEGSQVTSVALLDKQKRKVLTVGCDQTQAYGLWAPAKPGCPFVCLEPWCGITDTAGFEGEISERELNHRLEKGETMRFEYWVEVE